MPNSQGKNLRVQVELPPGSGQYQTVSLASTDGMTVNNTQVDNTNKDSGGWRDIFTEGSVKSVTLTNEHTFGSTASQNRVRDIAFSTDPKIHARLIDDDVNWFVEGDFHITSYEHTGEVEGFVNASVTLESTGVVVTGTLM